MPSPANGPTAARLRYRFSAAAQVDRHFHQQDGQALFFFPGIALPKAQPVLLDVQFASSDQSCLLRGRALEEEPGRFPGAWLGFPARKLVTGLNDASMSVRRRHRRLAADLLVRVQLGPQPCIGRLVDLSLGGARLDSVRGDAQPGHEIRISLFDAPEKRGVVDSARVTWARKGELGARFLRADSSARHSVSKLLSHVQDEWQGAPEKDHPHLCGCSRAGELFEPPVPRAGYRWGLEGG